MLCRSLMVWTLTFGSGCFALYNVSNNCAGIGVKSTYKILQCCLCCSSQSHSLYFILTDYISRKLMLWFILVSSICLAAIKTCAVISDYYLLETWNLSKDDIVLFYSALTSSGHFFVLSWENNCPVIFIQINMHMNPSEGHTLSLADSTVMKNWCTSCNLGQAWEHEVSWNMMTLNKQCQSRANGLMWCVNVLKKKIKLGWVQGR